jgi:hypothetical protein
VLDQLFIQLRFQAQPAIQRERRWVRFRRVEPPKRAVNIIVRPHGELFQN